ncbi:MAG: hypothetical protein QOK87_09345, partial [Nitrososphaeraceae archaeon]|nr:hypothetical protein [Nitrososphaeraceae archaeon]
TTPIPPMHVDSTCSGECTSGSTALPGDVTRWASGFAATTSTTSAERNRGIVWHVVASATKIYQTWNATNVA